MSIHDCVVSVTVSSKKLPASLVCQSGPIQSSTYGPIIHCGYCTYEQKRDKTPGVLDPTFVQHPRTTGTAIMSTVNDDNVRDFANDLESDIGPLLDLFEERMTMQNFRAERGNDDIVRDGRSALDSTHLW